MKHKYQMRFGLAHSIIYILLYCCAEKTDAFDFMQFIKLSRYTNSNSTSKPESLNTPPVSPSICNFSQTANTNFSLESLQILQNNTDPPCCYYLDASLNLSKACPNITLEIRKIKADYDKLTNITSLSNLNTSEILDNIDMDNATHYMIWKHFINFTNFVIYEKYMGENYNEKDSRLRKYLGAHKLLALFLGMAGVLACLLIIIYCIYIRQHKEDMFSHHRLYGEGFEDPVLHLDTPVDHLDFFSFRDTEITPYPTPQHKCQKTETMEYKGDYTVEDSKNATQNDHLHQVIQMGTMKYP